MCWAVLISKDRCSVEYFPTCTMKIILCQLIWRNSRQGICFFLFFIYLLNIYYFMGLVSLFDDILIFESYQMPKRSLLKNSRSGVCVYLFVCLFGYGISTFVGYLIPNQFLYKFYFEQFSLAKTFLFQAIQFSQTVLFQTI